MAMAPVEPRGGAPTGVPVTPVPAPAPAPAVAPQAEQGSAAAIPDEVAALPPIAAVLAGEPAAVSANLDAFQKRPEGQLIVQNAPVLQEAGIGFYTALDSKTGVLFNQFHMAPEELQAADKAGELLKVAPPFDEVAKTASGKAGADSMVKGIKDHPGITKQAAAPSPDQSASAAAGRMKVPSPAAGAQTQRQAAQSLGAPSSGPKPGAGRILNNILKPVV